jgi:hypothetical protein
MRATRKRSGSDVVSGRGQARARSATPAARKPERNSATKAPGGQTGPKTPEGKLKSRGNAIKHGMTATTIEVLPTEDVLAFDQLLGAWVEDLDPANRVQLGMAQLAAQMMWKLRRADTVQTARFTAQVEKALSGETTRLAAASLGERLFHNPQGPDALYGAGQYDDRREPRISWSPVIDDPDSPAKLLFQLQATADGCAFLLKEWETLRSQLEAGQAWVAQDTFRAVRLLGCNPLDSLSEKRVAQLFIASASFAQSDRDPFASLLCELNEREYAVFVQRVEARWAGMRYEGQEEGQRGLLSIIDERIEDLMARAAVHEQNAERDTMRLADCVSFDGSREGELLRRYQMASQRALSRALGDLIKLKRADRQQTPAGKGRTRRTVDTAAEPVECGGNGVPERVDTQAAVMAAESAAGAARSGQLTGPAREQLGWDFETTSGDALADYETKSPDSSALGEVNSGDSWADHETKCPVPADALDETKSLDSNAAGETKSDGAPANDETKSLDPNAADETKSATMGDTLAAKLSGPVHRFETKRSASGEYGPHWARQSVSPSLARAVEPMPSRAGRRLAKAQRKSISRELRAREAVARRGDLMAAHNSERRPERGRAGGDWEPDRVLATFGRSTLLKALPGSELSQLPGGHESHAGLGAVFEPAHLQRF